MSNIITGIWQYRNDKDDTFKPLVNWTEINQIKSKDNISDISLMDKIIAKKNPITLILDTNYDLLRDKYIENEGEMLNVMDISRTDALIFNKDILNDTIILNTGLKCNSSGISALSGEYTVVTKVDYPTDTTISLKPVFKDATGKLAEVGERVVIASSKKNTVNEYAVGVILGALAFGAKDKILEACEKFNGSAWSNTGRMLVSRHSLAGCGNAYIALNFGGLSSAGTVELVTEIFNGSSWSSTGNMLTARHSLAGSGLTSKSISIGGIGISSQTSLTTVEIFNGTTWVNGPKLNRPKSKHGGCGTGYNSIVSGGASDKVYSTEIFNDVVWTVVDTVDDSFKTICGTLGSAIGVADNNNYALYHGTSWKNFGKLSSNIQYTCGSSFESLGCNGLNTYSILEPKLDVYCKLYSKSKITPIIKQKVWSSSINLLSPISHSVCIGTAESSINIGGKNNVATVTTVNIFNGSCWASLNNIPKANYGMAGCGVFNSAIVCGGYPLNALSNKFNGSTWSASVNMITNKAEHTMVGMFDSAYIAGGIIIGDTAINVVEHFNGLTWSSRSAMNNGLRLSASFGNINDDTYTMYVFGGHNNFGTHGGYTDVYDEFNDTWRNIGYLRNSRSRHTSTGTVGSSGGNGLMFGGYRDRYLSSSERYIDNDWKMDSNLITSRSDLASCGNHERCMSIGGTNGMSVVEIYG